ncbi:elongation factor Ts [Candidatus Kaiserbacteria bacterium CG10_big_fil_rev_8_21_14_0_10_59_10]|uniref:Elongation factor Ts n=1 Tax=Candidatus Kaiserbacteria bacterium CG10_big_fil_rev_8_21_14_0_10_59_10 TaxID=1974612 RepID=A0A2H0U8M2_9BACT|nr:MAG: elongation factor Ts [Candidatus Kaiserbacteria bacterium CG10_big_fil_rev_8_21_14_0_10_59_10]
MEITTDLIKQLRDETGVSVMQCKKALEEAGGDVEKAKVILRKASSAVASKKADRELAAGTAAAYTHAGGSVVGAVVLACETDFVSKNEEFKRMAYDIAMHVAAMAPQFISKDDVSEADTAAAREVFAKEAASVPEHARANAVSGKLDQYLAEKVLMEQPFVKDQSMTVRQYIEQGVQKFGEKIQVVRMERLSVR